jgi:1-phosphofructokinase family hexose kinase
VLDVLAVSANPAIDRVAVVPGTVASGTLRAAHALETPGGKGAHVALVAHDLGARAHLVTVAGGHSGDLLRALLGDEALDATVIETVAPTRATYTILGDAGDLVEVLEPATTLADDEVEALLDAVGALAADARVAVVAGSAPDGPPAAFAAELVRAARAAGARVLVDCSGPALAAALEAEPDLVLPNAAEAAHLLDEPQAADAVALAAAARGLCARGAGAAVVTAAALGAVAVADGRAHHVQALRVPVPANAVGCGDALAAGVATGLARGDDLARALALGVAAATDKLGRLHPGHVDRAAVEALLADVAVTRLEPLPAVQP